MGGGRVGAGADYRSSCGLVVVLGLLGLIAATSLLAAKLVWEGDGWVLEQTTGRVVGWWWCLVC